MKPKPITFKDLPIGQSFDFISGTHFDSFYKPVVKTGPRSYQDETGMAYKVGSISAKVYHVGIAFTRKTA